MPQGRRCKFAMSSDDLKVALIIDPELPIGLLANTAAVLALTLGRRMDGLIGPDVMDGSGQRHLGITTVTLPVLSAPAPAIRELWIRATELELLVVDFSEAAQTTTTYDAYTAKLKATPAADVRYLGIAICGARKLINKLAGSLAVLR
jgi:hypothetical protein